MNPMCGCGVVIESIQNFLVSCNFYHAYISDLLNSIYDRYKYLVLAVNELNEYSIINFFLFGSGRFHKEAKRKILL